MPGRDNKDEGPPGRGKKDEAAATKPVGDVGARHASPDAG